MMPAMTIKELQLCILAAQVMKDVHPGLNGALYIGPRDFSRLVPMETRRDLAAHERLGGHENEKGRRCGNSTGR